MCFWSYYPINLACMSSSNSQLRFSQNKKLALIHLQDTILQSHEQIQDQRINPSHLYAHSHMELLGTPRQSVSIYPLNPEYAGSSTMSGGGSGENCLLKCLNTSRKFREKIFSFPPCSLSCG